MSNFFAARLLKELDQKTGLEALEEAMIESRKVGFNYADDEEALAHFASESDEVKVAFKEESPDRLVSEAGDLQVMLVELVRRRGGSLGEASKQSARKFLKRLEFVEDKMKAEGKTWADVGTWADDVKPNYWDKAKAAGL